VSDVLGIASYTEDGKRWFRASGLGPSYQAFYVWLRSKKLSLEWTDFPWHGFSFADETDGDELISRFSSSYIGHDDDIDE
jgi:hypothetical protein